MWRRRVVCPLPFDLSFLPAHRKSSYWSPADITRPLSSHWHVTQDTTMTLDGGCETLVLASKGAPLSSSSSTAVSCPLRAAQWSGVRPSCGTKTVNMCRLSMLQNNDDLTLTHNGTFFKKRKKKKSWSIDPHIYLKNKNKIFEHSN